MAASVEKSTLLVLHIQTMFFIEEISSIETNLSANFRNFNKSDLIA